jgi:hypothetical protein
MLCGYKLPHGEVWQTTTASAEQTAAYTAVQVKPPPRHYAIVSTKSNGSLQS